MRKPEPNHINRNTFNFHFVIGIGGFGKVWKVEHKKTGHIYAMKEMSKALYVPRLTFLGSSQKKASTQ